ncbi:hypothetical protein HN011_006782, partial [Eciton burchellii]
LRLGTEYRRRLHQLGIVRADLDYRSFVLQQRDEERSEFLDESHRGRATYRCYQPCEDARTSHEETCLAYQTIATTARIMFT